MINRSKNEKNEGRYTQLSDISDEVQPCATRSR